MKNFLFTIFSIIIILIITFNIFSAFNIPFLGYRMYRIGSGSMEPYLEKDALIIIKENETYRKNDIVTYEKNGEYITHRIISIDRENIITKGDANNIQDDPIKEENIIGKLIFKINFNKYLNALFQPPFSLIVVFIIGLIITWMIPDRQNNNKNNGRGKHANW